MNYIFPFLSVCLGFLFVYVVKPSNPKVLKILLAFSGGFLLATTIFHLIPEVFTVDEVHVHEHTNHHKDIGIFVMIGILFQICLEYFSKGAEHGHMHENIDSHRFPMMLFVSLFLHAFLEGFPIHQAHQMLTGIIVHKLPVAMILSFFLIKSKLKRAYVFLFMFLFAIATPMGTLLAEQFTFVGDYFRKVMAVVIGVFLHISTTILFESSAGHKYNIAKVTAIISAVTIAYFV